MWIFQRWKPCNIVKKIKKKKRPKILIESDRKGKNLILLAILNIDAFCLNKISKLLCNFHKIFEYIIYCCITTAWSFIQQKIIYSQIVKIIITTLKFYSNKKHYIQNSKKNKIFTFSFRFNQYFRPFFLFFWDYVTRFPSLEYLYYLHYLHIYKNFPLKSF